MSRRHFTCSTHGMVAILQAAAVVCFLLCSDLAAAEPKLEFNKDIRPILAENCFTCHGQDSGARKAKLRLDQRDAALVGGKSEAPAIVPGNPDDSELLLRVSEPADSDDVMPPVKSKKPPLKPQEIAALRAWIAQGAEYQPHWSFMPPKRPIVAADPKLGPTPLDRLVAVQRKKAGLSASRAAAPERLIRRLSLDLTGLPPTLQEVDEFVAASAHDGNAAYRTQVDKYLASPRYGEKWARHWLDASRYADSDGYEKDLPRDQWAWRDWVIGALNSDKPYDQFIIEQIAGDLLVRPGQPLREQQDLVVATGYVRNSMVSEEGAIITEQYRKEGMFDRMDALGKGVLGLTVQCAQCHTHKFDPIKHDEYYQMFAYLDDTYEATSRIYSAEKLAAIERIQHEISAAETRLAETPHPGSPDLASWIDAQSQKAATTAWTVLHPKDVIWEGGLSHPEVLPDQSILSLGFRPSEGELRFTAEPSTSAVTGLRIEALTHGDLIFGGPGRSINGLFAISELVVEAQAPGEKDWKKIPLVNASADFASPKHALEAPFAKGDDDRRVLGPVAFLIDGEKDTAWSPDRGAGRRNVPTEAVVQFKEPVDFPAGTLFRGTLVFKHGGKDGHGRHNNHLGRFRVSLSTTPAPTASTISTAARLALSKPAEQRSPAERAELSAAWRASIPEFAATNTEVGKLWATFPEADTTVLHIAQRSSEDRRTTFLLDRGAWDKPKHAVVAATPAFLHAMPPSNDPPRLAFARWFVDRKSPTAARVAVNRTWQALFGAGLVEAPEDFGVRANQPIQSELLDWLAVEFMDHGWSQKQLIRAIVTSATYRQDSNVTPELLERDPGNRLFARGPRFRADAEVVRDIALSTGGLLEERVGGPSIYPPVPPSFFAESYIPMDFWNTATGKERYRRSLYVFRRRSLPDPVLASFDAPPGSTACVRRERSNSPLAALASLNEITFVEAAQALALRVVREGGSTDAARADYAIRLCTARHSQPKEVAEIIQLLDSRRARLKDGWLSARTVAFGTTETLPTLPPAVTPNDVAAWTIAARVLLNLDETLTKN
ncbi:MAG: PSD1 and planctomycete cytochrome C domain-containing protein [Opitutus sp.]